MSGPTDADARIVLRRFGLPAAPAVPLGSGGGFSGARLWRVCTDRGEFCLKAWPPGGTNPQRHAEIVRLTRSARQAGLTFVPLLMPTAGGEAQVEFADRLWDLADWMPGSADFHADPSPTRLRAACRALAQLHLAWARFGSPPRRCPAVVRRLISANEWLDAAVTVSTAYFESISGWPPLA